MAMPAILRSMFERDSNPNSTPGAAPSSGGTLVCPDGRALPLRQTALRARAKGGVARTLVRQTFVNPYEEALEVTYQLPLPVDGAVSGFRFELDGVEVVGEVDRKHRARERYEQAIVEGRTAALLEQERPNLFTQRVGNIPPKSTLVAEITVDQRLTWLDEGAWEWRFPSVVGVRYMGEEGRVSDVERVRVEVSEKPLAQRMVMELTVGDSIPSGYKPESVSHALEGLDASISTDAGIWGYRSAPLRDGDERAVRVGFGDREGVRLDRDVVVRWPVAEREPGVSLDVVRAPDEAADKGSAYGLLTIVPPRGDARMRALPRDLIVLIDTSGSMGGRPLEQAARVVSAMIDTLSESDRIELIEFSSSPRRWKPSAVTASDANRRDAIAWVKALRAGGATEMRAALLEALRPLRSGAQRQVVLITDGYIGFEREIVETVYQKLPADCRLHTLGVGSSVNRALTAPAAQAGRGIEVVVGLEEDPERAARRMVERTDAPLVTELTIEGSGVIEVSPARLPDLFAASPVLVSMRLGPVGSIVKVRGKTARGTWEQTLRVPEAAPYERSAAVRARFARDRVEDHELHLAAGGYASEIDREIETLGVTFQIATRLTSWVAISRDVTVGRNTARRHETQPQEMVHGVSVEGVGLRAPTNAAPLLVNEYFSFGDFDDRDVTGATLAGSASPAQYAAMNMPMGAPGAPPPPAMSAPSPVSGMDRELKKEEKASVARMAYAPPSSSVSYSVSSMDPNAALPQAAVPSKRSRRGLFAALLALIVALLIGWFVYRSIAGVAPPRSAPTPTRVTDAPRAR